MITAYKIHYVSFLVSAIISSSIVLGSNNYLQTTWAQTDNVINSFDAEGYTGQLVVLPPSIPQVPVSDDPTRASIGLVIGGNWSLSVNEGNLEKFSWNATVFTLTGEVNGTYSIDNVRNITNIAEDPTDQSIALQVNDTSFEANADISIDNNIVWSNVPIVFYLLNGNIVNLTVDNTVTNNSFPIPLYGIVTSINK